MNENINELRRKIKVNMKGAGNESQNHETILRIERKFVCEP